jgi:hypothetical protein
VTSMKIPTSAFDESPEDLARRSYCVCDFEGREDPERLRRAVEAVINASDYLDLPDVPGVPRLRHRIDEVSEIPEVVRLFLPEVEADARLHALSFVDPLRVANELGIAVSPTIARTVRRGLAGSVSFDLGSLDPEGRLVGVGEIRWRPKTKRLS